MKRRSVFPFIGTQKAKTTNVDLYLGDDPNKNWKEFIQCSEEVVSYMYLNDRCGLEGFEKNYEKLTKGKTVTVSSTQKDGQMLKLSSLSVKAKTSAI